jgi:hypothetical protein
MYCSAARAGLPINGPILHVADKRLLEILDLAHFLAHLP